jgi:hypothetical protein
VDDALNGPLPVYEQQGGTTKQGSTSGGCQAQ